MYKVIAEIAQKIIDKIVKWMYADCIREYDVEYYEAIKGKQFPDIKTQYKNSEDFLTYQGPKIPIDIYVNEEEFLKELGKTDNNDYES